MERLESVDVEIRSVPLPRRGKVPLTSAVRQLAPTELHAVLVQVRTDAGRTGLGFAPRFGPGAALIRQTLEAELTPLVRGESAANTERLLAKAEHHFREVGWSGLPALAFGLIDIALWDLKAQAAGVPLAELLGGARPQCNAFQTETLGPIWDVDQVAQAAKAVQKQGGLGVRVHLGCGDVQADADRVRELHDACGEETWIGVHAAGRYDLNTAMALAHFLEDQGVDWFENPLPATDRHGYAKLAERLEIPLAVGSPQTRLDDFLTMIRDGFVRLIRPDVVALGGLTPTLRLIQVAQSFHVHVSPRCSSELGVHLGCGLAGVTLVDRRSWLTDLFDIGLSPDTKLSSDAGSLAPPATPGLGVRRKSER